MQRKLNLRLAVLAGICSWIAIIGAAEAQQCPPDDGCGPWGLPITATMILKDPGCEALVTTRQRLCGGALEFYIDNVVYKGLCKAMEQFSIYQYSFNAAMEYITLAVVQGPVPGTPYDYPPCGSGNGVQIANVYTASCGIWVGCEYKVTDDPPVCDQGFDPPNPDYGEPKKVKVYRWQPCGTTCCKRTFELCRDVGPATGQAIVRAIQVSKVRLTPCSDQGKYGASQPCQDGC